MVKLAMLPKRPPHPLPPRKSKKRIETNPKLPLRQHQPAHHEELVVAEEYHRAEVGASDISD